MVQESEILNLALSLLLILVYFSLSSSRVKVPGFFLTSILVVTMGQIFTVLEGFFLENMFDILEHLSYLTGSVFILLSFLHPLKRKNHGT